VPSTAQTTSREPRLTRGQDGWTGRFHAMACPCEVLIEQEDEHSAQTTFDALTACAWRIEEKYSRYRTDNVVHAINTSQGKPVRVDDETANLLDFAATLHRLSEGQFDITSGVLRRAWTFDGTSHVPSGEAIKVLLPLVGWHKVRWHRPMLELLPGMQIDFGGIGKEYAVDQCAQIAGRLIRSSSLINLGGDLAITRPRLDGAGWRVGIESVAVKRGIATKLIELRDGALATSGDTYRFILKDGKRYTHILNPRTGWPVEHAPRTVTVAADTCTQAGVLTTLAMLQGKGAEAFLEREGVQYWIQR
jgi:FAD:protein FMN transferase